MIVHLLPGNVSSTLGVRVRSWWIRSISETQGPAHSKIHSVSECRVFCVSTCHDCEYMTGTHRGRDSRVFSVSTFSVSTWQVLTEVVTGGSSLWVHSWREGVLCECILMTGTHRGVRMQGEVVIEGCSLWVHDRYWQWCQNAGCSLWVPIMTGCSLWAPSCHNQTRRAREYKG